MSKEILDENLLSNKSDLFIGCICILSKEIIDSTLIGLGLLVGIIGYFVSEDKKIKDCCREVLNFNITLFLICLTIIGLLYVLPASLILPIIAAFKTSEGKPSVTLLPSGY